MKKFFIFLAAAVAAVSCTMEINSELPQEQGGTPVAFTASLDPGTKALLDGLQVKWEAEDAISVFDASLKNCKFTSNNTEPAVSAIFTGTVTKEGEKYYGLYPYSGSSSRSKNTVNPELSSFGYYFPITQKCPAEGVDKKAMVLVAESEGQTLAFQPFCGLLKFTIKEEGITKMSFKCNGTKSLGMSSYYTSMRDNGTWYIANPNGNTDHLDITPAEGDSFAKGSTYYMALLPGTYSKGVIFTFTRSDGKVAVMSSLNDLVIGRGDVKDLGSISELDWKNESQIPVSFQSSAPLYSSWFLGGYTAFVIPIGERFMLRDYLTLSPETADQRYTIKSDNPDIKIDSEGGITMDVATEGILTMQSLVLPALKTTIKVSSWGNKIDGVYYLVQDGKAMVTNKTYTSSSTTDSYTGDVVVKSSVEIGGKAYPVKTIAMYAFAYSEGLESVTICEGVDTVKAYGFINSKNLKSIQFPKTLQDVNTSNQVFAGCPDLVATVAAGSEYFVNKGDMLYKYEEPGKPELKFIWMPENKEGDVVFDPNTTSFADFSMTYIRKAQSLEIPACARYHWYLGWKVVPNNFVLKYNYPSYDAYVEKFSGVREDGSTFDYTTSEYVIGSKAQKAKITLSVPASTSDADLAKYQKLGYKSVIRRTN